MSPVFLILGGLYAFVFATIGANSDFHFQDRIDLGCFKDNPRKRVMTQWMGHVTNVGDCIDRCRQKNQPYVSLQNGYGCRCGDKYDIYGTSNNCNKLCPSGENCGGFSTNKVYGIGSPLIKNLGCFKDHPTKRMMKWGGHYDSVMQCVQICIKKNYQYVGLQSGGDCWCGERYNIYGSSERCNRLCNSKEQCGGSMESTVYKISRQSTIKLGCYKDVPGQRSFTIWKGKVLNVIKCLELCKIEKKPFAAVQNGYGCRCGINYAKHGKSKQCTKLCPSGENCGGFSANMVYQVCKLIHFLKHS